MALVLTARDGEIATLTINRPEKKNALNRATFAAIGEAIVALSADDALRCVVIRGAGGTFVAGADMSGFDSERANRSQVRDYSSLTDETLRAIAACRHPTVALIEGYCMGAGVELAAGCDLRIAGRSAKFAVPAKRVGLFLSYPLLEGLMRIVGPATAAELVLEGRVMDADEALRKGLVTRVVADGAVADEAYATARRIAEGAPLAARHHKRAIRRLSDPRPIGDAETEASYDYADSEDYKIGYRAFLAKKKPEFKGR
jgi:enoyl-CoA hydratase/carnithine racemase